MATKSGGASFKAVIGYDRLPSRTSQGSKASFNKMYTKSARESMQGVIKEISAIFNQTKAILPDVMEASLQPTFERSQLYCPVKTGLLKSSGDLSSGIAKGRPTATISYGNGGEVHYAAMVHEMTENFHEPPTRSKFLQSALEEDINNILPRIQAALRVS